MNWKENKIHEMNKFQDEAVLEWMNNKWRGCVLATVGSGKSFIVAKAIQKAYEKGKLKDGDSIYLVGDNKVRERTFFTDEFPKYKDITGFDIMRTFDMNYACVQSKPKIPSHVKMLIIDEADVTLTPKYFNIIKFDGLLLAVTDSLPASYAVYRNELHYELTKKIKQSSFDQIQNVISEHINKGQLLDMYCPIVYELTEKEAVNRGIIAPLNTYILSHDLDRTKRTVKVWKSANYKLSEYDAYMKWEETKKDYESNNKFQRMQAGLKQTRFLYDVPSKSEMIKKIYKQSYENTLVYNPSLKPLRELKFINVAEANNYKRIITDINTNRLIWIGTSKRFQRGITLPNLTNTLFYSFNTSYNTFKQLTGRARRLDYEGKVATNFMFVTKDTLEEKWLDELSMVYDKDLQPVSNIDLNIVRYVETKKL